MNCLTAFFFLLFFPLLSIDAQARLMPGMSLNDESIILNMGGRISSLPPPSSTISSPRSLMEIRRSSSSSIFEMMFDVIGWITGGAPDPKAAKTIEQQQVNRKSDQTDETAEPCDKSIIPSSNLILPSTLPAPGAMLLPPISECPPIQSLVHPSPIMPSPTTLHATLLPETIEQQQVNRKNDQNDESAKPCDKLMIPSSNLILPPTLPPRAMLLSPIPACPPIESLLHPSPKMPSSTTPHATPLLETIEQQQVIRKSDQNDETAKPCDQIMIHSSNLILPPTLPAPRAMLLPPIPASPPIQSLVHPYPKMPSPTTPHATPLPANLFSPPKSAVPPNQNSVHPPPPIMPSPENKDQIIDGIRSTTSFGNSVISMITHPQNDHLQVS
ncbi:hypothetical protein ES288_D05G126300v1 [Gossypium darwinii]|uniref:Uncharacterized protein n=1 Tax=Gossypium darwinii TaxID=34276 RepID=A0A5D2CIR4_GOSDA|nr:hypothetical protein ES288_D05G126300v1 [Gossypium darwinii]